MRDGLLLMIGCGRMGGALLSRWRTTGACTGPVAVVKPTDALPEALRGDDGITHYPTLDALPKGTTPMLVVLAVKPQQMMAVLADCAAKLPPSTAYLTIAAGLPLARYSEALGPGAAIVRAMPNLPARIGEGVSVLVCGATVEPAARTLADTLMRAVGEVVWLGDESLLDAATAIAGSGPAYLFQFMKAMIAAGVSSGLDDETARALVVKTVRGSALLADLPEASLDALQDEVTSRGGTTEAALEKLRGCEGIDGAVERGVEAALQRSRILAASA